MPDMRQSFRAPMNRFRRDVGGATAVEFALVAPMLFFALLSLLEIGVLCMMTSGVDNAVAGVARTIRTGQDDAPATAAAFEDQVCARMGGDLAGCRSRLTVSVHAVDRFADLSAITAAAPAGEYNKGDAGDIILVKADYAWPIMTPFLTQGYERSGPNQIVIASRVAFKNEPFQ